MYLCSGVNVSSVGKVTTGLSCGRLGPLAPSSPTWEMEPPWMKEGLSVGLVVGMSGGGEGMLGGRLGLLNVTRTPSGILWTSWLEAGWRTGGNLEKKSR